MRDAHVLSEGLGYTQMAQLLTKHSGWHISRQQVWVWWSRRHRNGFPNGWDRPTAGGGVRQFDPADVLTWYDENYDENGMLRRS
jgi:hypothetical protein